MIKRLNGAAFSLLLHSSRKAIPFNVLLGALLMGDLIYNKVPWVLSASWFAAIVVLSTVRWVFCGYVLRKKRFEKKKAEQLLSIFFVLTLCMGITWGLCYPLSLPYLGLVHEFIVILVLGGMSAGSIASLSIYLPAYYAYVLPMFVPVILYNFSTLDIDRAFMGTIFTLFIVMLLISARINSKLFQSNIQLSREKDTLINKLKVISITDPLTGSYNRRYFNSIFPKEFNRAKRHKHSLNLILIDVDNFKLINDNLGHPCGDKLLIDLAKILKNKLKRADDTIFRLGGDEFAAIVSNQTVNETVNLCNNINSQFKEHLTRNAHQIILPKEVALSMGVVSIHQNCSSDLKNTIDTVDKALYEAKNHGKNQIVVKQIH